MRRTMKSRNKFVFDVPLSVAITPKDCSDQRTKYLSLINLQLILSAIITARMDKDRPLAHSG